MDKSKNQNDSSANEIKQGIQKKKFTFIIWEIVQF